MSALKDPDVSPEIEAVFTCREPDVPTWPHVGYDYEGRMEELMGVLREELPGIDFSPQLVASAEEAEAVSDAPDGYMVYMIGGMWTGAAEEILSRGEPTVLVDDLYAGSGGFLNAHSMINREGLPAVGVASSDMGDVIEALSLFEVLKAMEQSKIIVVGDQEERGMGREELAEKIGNLFGTAVERVGSAELNERYEETDPQEATQWREKWIEEAKKVVEPDEEEILKSARMYLALKGLLAEKGAQAVTVDCLGLYYGDKLPAYPCLAFFQLNNEGSTGVCEADLDSTVTQLLMRYAVGRPGYVSDPVIDTASNQIIYAHCVSTNRPYGPEGLSNPYLIRSHSEDRSGASVQSLLPLGERVTTAKVNAYEGTMALHRGRTVANVEEEKACRTKLAAETEAEKVLNNWNVDSQFGWHRVTFYGDWEKKLKGMARLLGLEVVEEDV